MNLTNFFKLFFFLNLSTSKYFTLKSSSFVIFSSIFNIELEKLMCGMKWVLIDRQLNVEWMMMFCRCLLWLSLIWIHVFLYIKFESFTTLQSHLNNNTITYNIHFNRMLPQFMQPIIYFSSLLFHPIINHINCIILIIPLNKIFYFMIILLFYFS